MTANRAMRLIPLSGCVRAVQVALALAATVVPARAERHALKIYTTADGLASSVVLDIVADSRGFVWFGTRNGLSRFDGSDFRTYTTDDGLPHPVVNRLLETRAGEYWIATNGGGVCRFNVEAKAASLFTCQNVGDTFLSNRVNVLHEDRRGRIWLGTDIGVFRMDRDGRPWRIEPVLIDGLPAGASMSSRAVYEDGDGRVWIGLGYGLLRLEPDDRRATLYSLQGRGVLLVRQVVERDGMIWVALDSGLLVIRPERRSETPHLVKHEFRALPACFGHTGGPVAVPPAPGDACLSDARSGLSGQFVGGLAVAGDGRLWIATTGGVAYVDAVGLTRVSTLESMTAVTPSDIAIDRQGHVWIGTDIGAAKLAPDGLVTYHSNDGLGHPRVRTIFERAGQVFVVSGEWMINRFNGRRFAASVPPVPPGARFSYYSHGAFLDRSGAWWLLSARGLNRLRTTPGLGWSPRHPPEATYHSGNGLPDNRVERLFEDARGDIWIATRANDVPFNLARWERATGVIRTFTAGFGPEHQFPVAFAEDQRGALWIAFEGGGLARYHGDRFMVFGAGHGVPKHLTALHVDASGRLWIASNSAGLSRLDDVSADVLQFSRYTTTEGLSSSNIQCLAEDKWGRVYLGTSRGIDRLDPVTRRIRHFTTSDGLANDYVTSALTDSTGALWFGTRDGVSRLVPRQDQPAPAPPIWIERVRAGGTLQPIPELGAQALSDLQFGPEQNHLEIEFFGAGVGPGGPLRYRYRLDGADTSWTGPTDRQAVYYASLAPGGYRFVVEAINADGIASDRPAIVSFTVLPPLWRRWWFMSLALAAIASGLYTVYRYRLAQLLALERVRTRIAADLHDDIGGSLSRIALQSEVARREVAGAAESSARRLAEIGETARTVVESMSDVVWSVDPGHDDLASVEQRLREYAADVLGARGVRWTFLGTDYPGRVGLDPVARRDLLLLLKEGITNIARHADASMASLHLRLEPASLSAELQDNGKGFDLAAIEGDGSRSGHGLGNMRARARQLGARLDIESAPGTGARIRLTMALPPRGRMNMRLWRRRRRSRIALDA
jgi:ligand-binding sensor domain-containing protein/two-component sensor histidine kinase